MKNEISQKDQKVIEYLLSDDFDFLSKKIFSERELLKIAKIISEEKDESKKVIIFNLIDTGQLSQSIITGNSRFLGATLLHVASSAAIGVMIGITYYKKVWVKKFFLILGIALSILLHTIFNLLIIKLENNLFFIFAGVWVLIILLIVLIEKVKKVQP